VAGFLADHEHAGHDTSSAR